MLDRLSQSLEHYMDLLSARQKLVASNIANADTPGYKTRDIDFQGEFSSAVRGARSSAHRSVRTGGSEKRRRNNRQSADREARLSCPRTIFASTWRPTCFGRRFRAMKAAIGTGTGA